MIKKVFYISVLIIMAFGCNKGISEPEPYTQDTTTIFYQGDPQLFHDFDFKVGSYWIYKKDDNTIDSVYVGHNIQFLGSYTYGPSAPGEGPGTVYFKYIEISLKGSAEPHSLYLQSNCCNFYSPQSPPIGNIFCYCNGQICREGNVSYIGDFSIDSTVSYSNVYKILFFNDSGTSDEPINDNSVFYISKDAGIIRKDLNQGNGTVDHYQLIRYKIVL